MDWLNGVDWLSGADWLSSVERVSADWISMGWIAAALFTAGLLKGFTGLGFSTCALPLLVLIAGVKTAVALVLAPAIASNVTLLWRTGHVAETIGRFWPLYLALAPGIALGISMLLQVDGGVASQLLGLITILYAGYALWRPDLALSRQMERPLQVPVGLLNGFITGLTGSQILPLLPYMMGLRLEPARFVQAVNLPVTIASVMMLGGLSAAGLMTWPLAAQSLAGIIPAMLGTLTGDYGRTLIPAAQFRLLVLYTLVFMGAMLMGSAGGARQPGPGAVDPESVRISAR
jgi:uncharacterized protein